MSVPFLSAGTGQARRSRDTASSEQRSGQLFPSTARAYPRFLFIELFGYSEGAFTGARSGGQGLVQQPTAARCFWTTIGDLPSQPEPCCCVSGNWTIRRCSNKDRTV